MKEQRTVTYSDDPLKAAKLNARNAIIKSGSKEFKTQGSAKWTDITMKSDGHILVQIEHDDIKGVTGEMIKWWFENLAGYTTWNGVDFSGPEVALYHLWHHRDHVAVTPLSNAPDGTINHGFREGADSRIEERFNEVHHHVYDHMHTITLTDREFTFNIMQGNKVAGHISHIYEPVEEGLSFYAETEVGMYGGFAATLFNKLVLPHIYTTTDAEHWIYHNIEETGRTEDVLPVLFANKDKVYFK